MKQRPVMLIIMDGWGVSTQELRQYDATAIAHTPVIDSLKEKYAHTTVVAHGEEVGLPEGQMGNSEVGHLNIGAGRIVYQELTRINVAIREGSFFENPVLNEACKLAKDTDKPLHLIGLVSDGGVHSELTHIYALLELAKRYDLEKVYLHVLLDGRDTPPKSGLGYVQELEENIVRIGTGQIATVAGRYYTMDRDKRWERVEKGYQALVSRGEHSASSATEAIEGAYARGESDEFVVPTSIVGADGNPLAVIQNEDPIILFNFRTDRLRELSHVFLDQDFPYFSRREEIKPKVITMTEYEAGLPAEVAFPPSDLTNTLGHIVAKQGLKQLRIAETEKYAHVTFFFNGGMETPEEGEDRVLIPSPKVATYDLQPEMSAPEVGSTVVEHIHSGKYDLIILNFANPDMVGHTGIMEAAVKACETVDAKVGACVEAVLDVGGVLLLCADHGNAECMWDPEADEAFTAHTCNPVPFFLIGDGLEHVQLREGGRLADIAPTILALMDLPQPEEMTGKSLF